MEIETVRELVKMLEASELCELEVEEQGWRVRLRKPKPVSAVVPVSFDATVGHVSAAEAGQRVLVHQEPSRAVKAEPAQEEASDEPPTKTIDAPMVGTFYSASAPGEPPFVQVGDVIREGQTICIVEAMKLMNEVTAKYPAQVVEILVQNGEPIEFAQPLFKVRPVESY